jgi:hypothetical protein
VPSYFPGTVDIEQASIVHVGAAEERSGVDFPLELVTTARVSGVVTTADGQPARDAQMQLVPRLPPTFTSDLPMLPVISLGMAATAVPILSDGTFSAPSVAPGAYVLTARGSDTTVAAPDDTAAAGRGGRGGRVGGPGALTLWAARDVVVTGADVPGLVLTLRHGMTVSGRVVVTGGEGDVSSGAPALTSVRVALTAAENSSAAARMSSDVANVDATGAFVIRDVVPGRYRVRVLTGQAAGRRGGGAATGAPGWRVASASLGERDGLDLPFDVPTDRNISDVVIRLTPRLAEITGQLRDAAGGGASGYVMVAFSSDRRYWGTANRRMPPAASTDADGRFRFSDLPAGEYFIAAATDLDEDDLRDPRALALLSEHASRVTVAEGDTKVQDFKIGGLDNLPSN